MDNIKIIQITASEDGEIHGLGNNGLVYWLVSTSSENYKTGEWLCVSSNVFREKK